MIKLPWFPKELKANSRTQHRYSKEARNKYKNDCYMLAGNTPEYKDNLPLEITFYPPTGHHRDLDNCLAGFKYGIDGIAERWGVNDKDFHPITIKWGAVIKHGAIEVRWVL